MDVATTVSRRIEEPREELWARTYTFTARSPAHALLLAPVVQLFWRGFMRRALDALADG